MKLSPSSFTLLVAFIGCLAVTSAQDSESAALLAAVQALAPTTESFSAQSLSGVNEKNIIGFDRVVLATLPAAGAANADARAVFSYWATDRTVVWKLVLQKVNSFTGAHLHLNSPPANGPIVGKRKIISGQLSFWVQIPKLKLFFCQT